MLLNVPVLVTNGYSIEVNGTEKILCYAWYDYDYTIFDIMGQVYASVFTLRLSY